VSPASPPSSATDPSQLDRLAILIRLEDRHPPDSAQHAASVARDADVIVTEIRVHGSFDGVELISRLRDADETKETPIIVLTACAFGANQERSRAAGCSVFLSKPCLPEQLVREISIVRIEDLNR
jgi:CheY-like chemotaxis protein